MSISDTSLITFKAISNFTSDLGSVFSDTHRSLKLYSHLINKTTISHDKPIQKHIDAFKSFCVSNREAIADKNIKGLKQHRITYSKRVFIDMNNILKEADKETVSIIWKHLLTISAIVDPTGKARKILKECSEKKGMDSDGTEIDFLSDIISKVEQNVDPNANPLDAVSSIMKSGVFTDLVNGMGDGLQNGSLDLNKLMGTVQKMVTKLDSEKQDGGDSEIIKTMVNSVEAGTKDGNKDGEQQMPDLSGMLGSLMGGANGGGNKDGDMSGLVNMLGSMMGGAKGKNMPDLSEITTSVPKS